MPRSGPKALAGPWLVDLGGGKIVADEAAKPAGTAGVVRASHATQTAILGGIVNMALGMYFTPSSFTPTRYDDTLKRLEEAGAGAPPGRLYHVAMESDGLIQVFDVWDSEESFQAFGATLLPIMAEQGVEPGQPQAAPVRNIIKG